MGLIISYWSVLEGSTTVKATTKKFKEFGILKDQKTRSLKKLRANGLIDYENGVGKNPIVTLYP